MLLVSYRNSVGFGKCFADLAYNNIVIKVGQNPGLMSFRNRVGLICEKVKTFRLKVQ